MSASIRDNIVFSHEFDESFYELVLDGNCDSFCVTSSCLTRRFCKSRLACALRPDLALLADGDLTQVGEKGITVRFRAL